MLALVFALRPIIVCPRVLQHCLFLHRGAHGSSQAVVTVPKQPTHTEGARIMVKPFHLQPPRLAQAPTRWRLVLIAGAALACTLYAGPLAAAAKALPSPQTPPREPLTIQPEEAVKPWTGDLAGMIKRGRIRVLTVYSKTFYFVNKGTQRGLTYDIFRQFEEELNKRLAKEQKLPMENILWHLPGCPSPATHPVRALRCEPAACRRHPALASRWRGACGPTPGAGISGQDGSRVAWGGRTRSVEKAV